MRIRKTFTLLSMICIWNVCAGQTQDSVPRTNSSVSSAEQGSITGFSGITLDAETGDTIPFVQMLFIGSSIGTTSDMDGRFTLSNTQGLTTVQASMVGYKSALVNLRPVPLTQKESVMDSLIKELRGVKKFQGIVRTIDVFVAEYILTSKDFADSKFDFGPIWNLISYNKVEGVRLRVDYVRRLNYNAGLTGWQKNGIRFTFRFSL